MTPLETLPEFATDAEFIDRFANNSQEWLDLRATGIGGSDVSTIVGLNKWESAVTFFYKRTGKIKVERLDSEAMYWGRALEKPIMDRFKADHPELEIWDEVGTWRNKDRSYQIVNPDGIYRNEAGEFGIIEIKTARYPDDWANGVPNYYQTQVQYYMSAFGLAHAYVAVLFSGSDYRVYELHADKFQQQVDLEKVEEFLADVAADKKPDWDGSDSTLETVRKMHPDIQDADVELGQLYVDYAAAKTIYNAADEKFKEMKIRVLDAMGDAKRGFYNGSWVLSRQAKAQGAPYLVEKRG